MATTTDWTDPDFDPEAVMERWMYDIQSERDRNKRREERNRTRRKEVKLRKKRDQAKRADDAKRRANEQARLAFQQQKATAEGEERRARREDRAEQFARRQEFQESQKEYRERRDAERQAYREAQDAERARRRAQAQQTPAAFSTGGKGVVPSGGGWAPDKEAVAKFIIFATAIGAIGAVINDLGAHAEPTKVGNVSIPAHLRAIGGAFLGAGIVGLIVLPNWTPLLRSGGPIYGIFSGQSKGGIAGPGEKFDPRTGILTGPRGTFRLVPVGNGNYSIEPIHQPVGAGGGVA